MFFEKFPKKQKFVIEHIIPNITIDMGTIKDVVITLSSLFLYLENNIFPPTPIEATKND